MKKVVIPVKGFQQAFTATAMAASLGLNRVVHSHKAYRTFIISGHLTGCGGADPHNWGRHEALGTSSLIGQLFYFRCSGCINFIGSRLIGLI